MSASEQVRSQIGKGGDKLVPVFLSKRSARATGKEVEEWRGERFKIERICRSFSPSLRSPATPAAYSRGRLRIAIASSAKEDELEQVPRHCGHLESGGRQDVIR